MNRFAHSVLCVIKTSLLKTMRSVTFYIILFFLFLFWYLFVWNIKGLAAGSGYGITPYLVPHFYANSVFYVYGLLLLVILACEAPFLDESRMYSISRSGKLPWALGQMIYIVLLNVIYQVLFFLIQLVTLLPYAAFSRQWGSVLYTAGNDEAALSGYSGYGSVSKVIITKASPLEAMGEQMLLCILFGSFIGVVTFLINGLVRKAVGSVVMVGCILASDFLAEIDMLFGTGYSRRFFFQWLNLEDYLNGIYDLRINALWLFGLFLVTSVIACVCVEKNWIKTTD